MTAFEASRRGAEASSLAVIDVGSNTARLVVYAITPDGGFYPVTSEKEVPRLGKDTAEDGSLDPVRIQRGVASLRRFAHRLDRFGRLRTVAVATSAVRDAPNRDEFLNAVRRETGLRLEVISGEREGRYAFLGASAAWELGRDLIVDLGGGSLQIVSTTKGRLERVDSLPLGALRLTQQFLKHDPPTKDELDELREHVRAQLSASLQNMSAPPERVFAAGGSVRELARASIAIRNYPIPQVHGYELRRRDLEALGEILAEMPDDRRRAVPGISRSRAEVIVASTVVLRELLRATERSALITNANGIREGIVAESARAALPAPAETLAYRCVTARALGFGYGLEHGSEVRRRAIDGFEAMAEEYSWGSEERTALSIAAWMHDIGELIEPWEHSRHSAYVLRHTALYGVTHRGVALAVLAAFLHEGDDPPEGWRHEWAPVLDNEGLETARRFGALLLLAETLAGTAVRVDWDARAERVTLRFRGPAGGEAPNRSLSRVTAPIRRAFGWEVVLPDGG